MLQPTFSKERQRRWESCMKTGEQPYFLLVQHFCCIPIAESLFSHAPIAESLFSCVLAADTVTAYFYDIIYIIPINNLCHTFTTDRLFLI